MKNWQLLLFCIILTVNNISFANLKVIDKIAAIVNNGIILESDINKLIKYLKSNINQINQKLPNNDILRHQVLERLIMDKIILQIGQKLDIKISNEQLDQAIMNIAKQNNITVEQIYRLLAYNGISYIDYRNQIHKEILISKIRDNEVGRRINILPQEITALAKQLNDQDNTFTKLNLSYILVTLPKNPTLSNIVKAENQAYLIVKQARINNNFAELFINYPNKQKTLKFKNMKWVNMRDLPYVLVQSLNKAKKGDIIGPIRSDDGFYILKINNLNNQINNNSTTEVHVRHILLKPSPILTDNQAKIKLEQIISDIRHGNITFANAAKKFSQDLNSADNGGDLGWLSLDKIYDPMIRNALLHLNKGQLSKPIKTSFGWHLIELLNIRNIANSNLLQREKAYNILFNRKFLEETESWMREQRGIAYVKILN